MTQPVNIVWFRRDLRVRDNPALAAAAGEGPVVPLFISSSDEGNPWAAARTSLRRQRMSLAHLANDLGTLGSRLVVRAGEPGRVLAELLGEVPVKAVHWNRCYEPRERQAEDEVREQLRAAGVSARPFDGNLLFDPDHVRTSSGTPYRVFTPFWRACNELSSGLRPEPTLKSLVPPRRWPRSTESSIPRPESTFDLAGTLAAFLDRYADLRDRPDCDGTSKLSARLHFGEIGPGQVWRAVGDYAGRAPEARERHTQAFLRQLVWREFAYHLLYHFPDTAEAPMRPEFNRFPWLVDEAGLSQWKLGRTGYPIVDAGMRQLARTGWIHNRVRLVVASFLVKHLLIDWRHGARHFWETLEDADLANNTLGWQWVAGSGADAAPYFRIFNPVLQGEKFDPEGTYVRAWVPEIAPLPDRWIHKPWKAPARVLAECGVQLGETYSLPIVDHAYARQRALDAYERMKRP